MRVHFGLAVVCASAIFVPFFAACGSDGTSADLDGGLPDAAGDARKIVVKDASKPPAPDAAYVRQGISCVRDGGPPPLFVPGDGGVDAAHPRSPQVISLGGPVLALPVFVPVTFDGDDLRGEKEDFLDSVGCTDYWRQIASDFAVGDGIGGLPVHLSEAAPDNISDDQIQAWLAKKLLTDPAFPKADANSLYVLFYPPQTTITLQKDTSCNSFGAYHNSVTVQGSHVAYAVIPQCGSFGALSGIDGITAVTSHELIEAATDPYPYPNPAYAFPEADGLGFALAAGGEVGDLCEFKSDAFFQPSGYPFYVQRSWSNRRAFELEDPCVPALPGPFFGVAPIAPGLLSIDIGMGPQTPRGVVVPLGQQVTISLTAFANGAVAPWNLVAVDATKFRGGKAEMTLSLSQSTVRDGDRPTLTIQRKINSPIGVSAYALISKLGGRDTYFWGLVGQ